MAKFTFRHKDEGLISSDEIVSTDADEIQDIVRSFSLFLQLTSYHRQTVLDAMESYLADEGQFKDEA
jgi:hypothetical protein